MARHSEIKNWLNRGYWLQLRMKQLENTIAFLESGSGGGIDYAEIRVHGGMAAPQIERAAINITALKEDLNETRDIYKSALSAILSLIHAVSMKNPLYGALLHARYIEMRKWESICNELNFSRSQSYVLYDRALSEASTILKDKTKKDIAV